MSMKLLTLLVNIQQRITVFVALQHGQLIVWWWLQLSVRRVKCAVAVFCLRVPWAPRQLLSLQLRLDSNLLHFVHFCDAFFQVLSELAAIVFVAGVEGDQNFAINFLGELNAVGIIWSKNCQLLYVTSRVIEKFCKFLKKSEWTERYLSL